MISNAVLFFSLFFPRLSLFVAWLGEAIPLNNIPFWGDFFMALFIPRVLMLIYIYATLGPSSGWFIAHLIFLILAWGSSGVSASASTRRD
jgi:hypothetical protein